MFNGEYSEEDKIKMRLVKDKLAKTYDEKLAVDDEENYWIDPKDDLCHKRGEPQFFINENGAVTRVTKAEYERRKAYLYKQTSIRAPIIAKKGKDVSLAQQGHDDWEFKENASD